MADLQPLVTQLSSPYRSPVNIKAIYQKLSEQVVFHLYHITLRRDMEDSLGPILGQYTLL